MNTLKTTRLQVFTQAIKSPYGWAGAILIAAALVAPTIPGPEDHQGEWTEADLMLEIQATEARTARREAAEQRLCNKLRGPNSEVRYTQDGDAVCTTRMGARKLVLL